MGLLATLAQAERSTSDFVVIEAVPQAQQDGPDKTFFWVYDNEWPDNAGALQPATAAPVPDNGREHTRRRNARAANVPRCRPGRGMPEGKPSR